MSLYSSIIRFNHTMLYSIYELASSVVSGWCTVMCFGFGEGEMSSPVRSHDEMKSHVSSSINTSIVCEIEWWRGEATYVIMGCNKMRILSVERGRKMCKMFFGDKSKVVMTKLVTMTHMLCAF